MGVSTKPGLMVVTDTPFLASRWRKPEAKADTSALALPYTA